MNVKKLRRLIGALQEVADTRSLPACGVPGCQAGIIKLALSMLVDGRPTGEVTEILDNWLPESAAWD